MISLADFERIIDSIADPVFVKDRQHRWILLNRAYCRFMGWKREELIGKSDYDFFPRREADVFWAKDELVFETGEENANDEEFTDAEGVTHFITTKKSLCEFADGEKYIVACIRDITALRHAENELLNAHHRLEAQVAERTSELAAANEALRNQMAENQRTADQLRQSQKLEAIGRLAGGVAHDFNNLLNVILGYSALVQSTLKDEHLQEWMTQVTTAADSAASLTRQLLAFSRKHVLQPEVLDLNQVLSNVGKMLPPLIGEDVELAILPEAGSACVRADRSQLEQVILNLVVNARDAMPLGGKLTLQTCNVRVDEAQGREHDVHPGEYVVLEVTDTGEGMDAATQAQIFEPFFTTKGPDKGTGLGLSTVYGILRQSRGHVRVTSAVGEGTTFWLYLPLCTEFSSTGTVAHNGDNRARKGTETILLVEDQDHLRGLLYEVLRSSGYRVMAANGAAQATELAKESEFPIDLLVTDVVMPGLRGWKLAHQLLQSNRQMKVIYISGYTDTDLLKEGALLGGETLIEKPFRPDLLLSKIREVLGERVSRSSAS